MKGRIRTIKPEIVLDEDLWNLCREMPNAPVFQVYTMLWCHADREERFEWRPQALKVLCCPYWEGDIDMVLRGLERHGKLLRYEVDGKQYGIVKNLKLHQAFNSREPVSKLPPPPGILKIAHADASAHSCTHAHAREERNGTELEGNGNGTELEHGARADVEDPPSRVVGRSEPTRSENAIPERDMPESSKVQPRASSAPQSGVSTDTPKSYSDVLSIPINERARWYLANLHQFAAGSDWAQPQKWPEVVDALTALSESDGKALRLGGYTNDRGVQRVIAHYADGWGYDELVAAYRRIPRSTWWLKLKAKGDKPTPGWVSSEVLRHAADAAADDSAEAALEVARRKVEVEKRAKVADLTANIEYRQKLIDQSDDDGWDEPDPQPQRLAAGQTLRALPSGGDR